mmetsp:Transcript_54893/g.128120  ORF Transcript_54893/g.128120 Transcript_54893/m.128120 type:complete len:166 (-) Transcript_54893:574-1071(-)
MIARHALRDARSGIRKKNHEADSLALSARRHSNSLQEEGKSSLKCKQELRDSEARRRCTPADLRGSCLSALSYQELDGGLLLVKLRHGQRCLPLRVPLVHVAPDLEKVLQEFFPPVARCVVQPAVAVAVHCKRVRPAVQEQFDHSDPVGADRVAEGCDALVILRV